MSSASMSQAVRQVLEQLYRGMIESDTLGSAVIPEKDQHNREIFAWYLARERAVDLAQECGNFVHRVNRLIRRYRDRGQE